MMAGTSELEFTLGHDGGVLFLTLVSGDGMNRLTRRKVTALKEEIEGFSQSRSSSSSVGHLGRSYFLCRRGLE